MVSLIAFATFAILQQVDADSSKSAAVADRILGQKTPGLAGGAVIIVKDDRVRFARGYGHAGRSGAVNIDSTLFRAASVGKLFIATAAMQLAERGRLDLDADIATYLTDLDLHGRGWPRVTMRQLLSHTAGVDDRFTGSIERLRQGPTTLRDYFMRNLPGIAGTPGEQVNYSNHGAALAALVIETIVGRPFAEVADAQIFAPLGMNRSSFMEPLPRDLDRAVAGDTSMMRRYRLIPYPAGTLVTTVTDMGRFLGAHLNGGSFGGARILAEASATAMHARVWSAHPGMPGVAHGFFESESNGRRVLFHTGSRGHRSVFIMIPEERWGFYAVVDAREQIASGILDSLTRGLIGAAIDSSGSIGSGIPRPTGVIDTDAYAGRYRLNMGGRLTFEKLAKLGMGDIVISQSSGRLVLHRERPMPLTVLDSGLFRTSDGMYVSFHRDAADRVDRMHASGLRMDGISLDRLAWWESSTIHRIILIGSYLLSWMVLVFLSVRALVRRLRGASRAPLPWPSRLAVIGMALFALSPVPAVLTMIAADDATVVELTPAVAVVRFVLALAALTAIVAASALVLGSGQSRPYRLRDGLFGLTACAVTFLLFYWRLLPPG